MGEEKIQMHFWSLVQYKLIRDGQILWSPSVRLIPNLRMLRNLEWKQYFKKLLYAVNLPARFWKEQNAKNVSKIVSDDEPSDGFLVRPVTEARPLLARSMSPLRMGRRRAGRLLTAGWLFSCFRTTPNIDDMAGNPLADRGSDWRYAGVWRKNKERLCRGCGGAGTRTSAPPAGSQSRTATTTAGRLSAPHVRA